jgi:hypothetical protein
MKCVVYCELAALLFCGVFLFAQATPPSTGRKAGGQGIIRLRINPCCPSVRNGEEVQFDVVGQSSIVLQPEFLAANWRVSGPGCKGAACGAVSSVGLYTAPLVVPNPPTVWVKATLASDTSKKASATVTVCSCDPAPAITNKCWSACVLPNPSHSFPVNRLSPADNSWLPLHRARWAFHVE